MQGNEAALKKTRFSEEQMVKILREADPAPVTEVAKKHGISEQTIYQWRKRFGKLEPADVKRLRHLKQENAKLKKLVAAGSRDRCDEGDCRKKMVSAAAGGLRRRAALSNQLGEVQLHELVEQRLLGPVAYVSGRIDERWRTRACPLAHHGLASLRWVDVVSLRV